MIREFIYDNYREIYPQLSGRELTDALIIKSVKEYGADIDDARVIRSSKGKPHVAPRSTIGLSVSVSHCLDTFACVVSDRNCGIDIQARRSTDVVKIAHRFFGMDEVALIEKEGEETFYRLWTRKEAYAKFTGNGIGEVLRGTQVIDREDVVFMDSVLDNGMYCSICIPADR